jgi:hypothetical protein
MEMEGGKKRKLARRWPARGQTGGGRECAGEDEKSWPPEGKSLLFVVKDWIVERRCWSEGPDRKNSERMR